MLRSVCRRLRVAVAFVVGLLVLTACGYGPGYGGLPQRPDAVGGPAPLGHIAYQPPLLPIVFSMDTNGAVAITLNPRLVTFLGAVTDNGPPAKLEALGPARVDVEGFQFNETSKDTDVDLERSRSGTTTDLSYDHMTAELKPIHGAKVATYATRSSWEAPTARSDYPKRTRVPTKTSRGLK